MKCRSSLAKPPFAPVLKVDLVEVVLFCFSLLVEKAKTVPYGNGWDTRSFLSVGILCGKRKNLDPFLVNIFSLLVQLFQVPSNLHYLRKNVPTFPMTTFPMNFKEKVGCYMAPLTGELQDLLSYCLVGSVAPATSSLVTWRKLINLSYLTSLDKCDQKNALLLPSASQTHNYPLSILSYITSQQQVPHHHLSS